MPTITLNSTNIVNNPINNKLVYQFQNGGAKFNNNDIALAQLSLYYSWFNINQQLYNNNTCSYTWIDGTVINITIPDGYYDAISFNAYLESVMTNNKHYLINTTNGDFVFYLQWETNVSYYALQLNCYAVPSSLGTLAFPSGATWTLPATPKTPQFTVLPLPSNFGLIVGFNAGTYPTAPQSTTYSVKSQFTPEINPISSLQITCSLITNPYSSQSKILYACGIPSIEFGQQITITPPNFLWNKISDGIFQSFTIDILDQNGEPIQILDPQINLVLNIRDSGVNQ